MILYGTPLQGEVFFSQEKLPQYPVMMRLIDDGGLGVRTEIEKMMTQMPAL